MKTTTSNKKSGKIKTSIKDTATHSKETIREIMDTNSKYIGEALDSNKKMVASIKKNWHQQEVEDSLTDTLKNTIGASVELTENTIDNLINSFTKRIEQNVDVNNKLVDIIKESNHAQPEKVFEIIHENFEASNQFASNNTKEILDFYNEHTNLVVNFNHKFGERMNTQIESLFKAIIKE